MRQEESAALVCPYSSDSNGDCPERIDEFKYEAGVLNLKLPGAANAAPQLFPGLQQVIVVNVRLESSGKNIFIHKLLLEKGMKRKVLH